MGYTVDELPLDYKPYLHVQGQTEDDVTSEDDVASEDGSASEDDDPTPHKKKHSKKHSKKDKKKSKKSKHSKKHKQVASSEDEHESTCEEDEELPKMSTTVVDITSALNVPSLKDAQWAIDASNENVEYTTNFMINGKHIVKLRGTNAYVALYTPENILGEGDVPEIQVLEQTILHKLKLRKLSTKEQEMVYGRESEDEEDIPVEGPADKSKVKWKKFHTGLEYSKNLLVNGKHILKMHKTDVVVGLVTDDHIRSEDVEYDALSHKEKEKIFAMGFTPDGNYNLEQPSSDEESDSLEEEHMP
ncbi:hypothetical protein BG003_001853, partial [Podila horticola]